MSIALLEFFVLDQLDLTRQASGPEIAPSQPVLAWWNVFVNEHLYRDVVYFALFSLVALVIVSWAKLGLLYAEWTQAARGQPWLPWLGLNAALFGLLLATGVALQSSNGEATSASIALWYFGVVLMALAFLRAAAPLSFWRRFVRVQAIEILCASLAAAFVSAFALMSQSSWRVLSSATLQFSRWMLHWYESGIVVDEAENTLGVGNFSVVINSHCSGYEGIGLVLGFLGLYVAMFRSQLRFPHVLLLFPIGALAIWLTNSVRIVALITIGAHWSPDIAVHGFHSHAGWIMFLAVAIGIMFLAHGIAFFRKSVSTPSRTRDPALRQAIAFLLPLLALMAGRLAAETFSAGGHWLYAIEAALGCGVFWLFRDVYVSLIASISLGAVVAGLAVGVIWIATDPGRGQLAELGDWIATLPPAAAVGWLIIRCVGSIALAPIAEELAFRGYLHRALISRRFESVAPGRFSWLAFLLTSVLFGLMHSRWLSAMAAGAVYAITMYRSNRLSDPIAAHITSNAIIAAWAIAANQYSLL